LKQKTIIVNYGMGNIQSLSNALNFFNKSFAVSSDMKEIALADKLILPGVGSFFLAMKNIKSLNIFEGIKESVLIHKKPLLGICLGMQILCESSNEDGFSEGFGFIPGKVEKFESTAVKIPHIGFNSVNIIEPGKRLFKGIDDLTDFYFTHSYRLKYERAQTITSWCDYGEPFAASVQNDNIFGTQFHPEKSQANGLRVLKNFLDV
jgi:glutamine amidotransferase